MNEFNNIPPENSLDEITTNKVEKIENLFGNFDEANNNNLLSELNDFEKTGPFYVPKMPQVDNSKKESSIDDLDLDGLKELRRQIATLQKQQEENNNENLEGQERGKSKKLTTSHYKEGIHYDGFSTGNLEDNFFRCAILGFVTLSISGGWFFYIMDHIL